MDETILCPEIVSNIQGVSDLVAATGREINLFFLFLIRDFISDKIDVEGSSSKTLTTLIE